MDCRFDKEILQRYVDNRIDPLELIFLKEHLKYCTSCKKDIEMLNMADSRLFEHWESIELPFNIDIMTESIVDKCIEEAKNVKGIRKVLKTGYNIGKDTVSNTTRFAKYIPGNKLIRKSINASKEFVSNSTKKYAKKRLKSLFGNLI